MSRRQIEAPLDPIDAHFQACDLASLIRFGAVERGHVLLDACHPTGETPDVVRNAFEFSVDASQKLKHEVSRLIRHETHSIATLFDTN